MNLQYVRSLSAQCLRVDYFSGRFFSKKGRLRRMEDVESKIVEILKKHMRDPPAVISSETKVSDLDIESLDLAMIVFDLEDTFGVDIPYNANEEVEEFATIGTIAEKVRTLIASSPQEAA